MGNMKKLMARGRRVAAVLVCMTVLMGAVGCASQTGESPKKPGGGCLSVLRLFS